MLRPNSKQFKNDVGACTKLYLTKACLTHTSNKVFHPTVRCLETLMIYGFKLVSKKIISYDTKSINKHSRLFLEGVVW